MARQKASSGQKRRFADRQSFEKTLSLFSASRFRQGFLWSNPYFYRNIAGASSSRMTPREKLQLRQAIEEKISESRKAVIDLRESTKPMGLDSAIGRVSRMDYINNKAIDEAELIKTESRLKALERWLSLYDTDQFGICTKCGQEINIQRLLLLPESTSCIHCATRT